MDATVYLETTVVSYLAARPSRDLILAAHQQVTHHWWAEHAQRFQLFVSQAVIREAAAGDATAAQRRLSFLDPLPLLELNPATLALAEQLIAARALPPQAVEDALHIAVATVHGMDFLLTWNMKHIANATMRGQIEATCRAAGYHPPVICTPEELIGGDHGEG